MPKLSMVTGLPPLLKQHGFGGPYLLKIMDKVGSLGYTLHRVVIMKQGIYDMEDLQNPGMIAVKCEQIEAILDEAIANGIDPWNPPPQETLAEALTRVAEAHAKKDP